MREFVKKAKFGQKFLINLTPKQRENLILDIAKNIQNNLEKILSANQKDIAIARQNKMSSSMIDRLMLDQKSVLQICKSLEQIATLADPVGQIKEGWVNHCGLKIEKISVPIGLVLIIYEARPNVTAEVAALCLKSSNAAILKGGKEAANSNQAIIDCVHDALKAHNLPTQTVLFTGAISKEKTQKLLKLDELIDIVIPRGGRGLIDFVRTHSSIPVIMHYQGICHIFVDEYADMSKALQICVNAKCSRPATCNTAETILVHEKIAGEFLPILAKELDKFGCEIFGCDKTSNLIRCSPLNGDSFDTEYLDYKLNIKITSSLDDALLHIGAHSSSHSEAIVSENLNSVERFLKEVDSACVYANASTRFSDGGEFGFGAEVGISTSKLHARGPMGVKELTTYKFIVRGDGQIR